MLLGARRSIAARPGFTAALVLALAVLGLAASEAHAEGYPARAVRLIVGFSPGGPNDLVARTMGQKLAELWGQAPGGS